MQQDPPEEGEEKGGLGSEIAGCLLAKGAGGRLQWSPNLLKSEQRERAPLHVPADDKRQDSGEVSNLCPVHRTNMVGHDPEDQRTRPLRVRAVRSFSEGFVFFCKGRDDSDKPKQRRSRSKTDTK